MPRRVSVNTIYRKNEKVYGENTDGKGFCEALIQETGFKFKQKKILVLGADIYMVLFRRFYKRSTRF